MFPAERIISFCCLSKDAISSIADHEDGLPSQVEYLGEEMAMQTISLPFGMVYDHTANRLRDNCTVKLRIISRLYLVKFWPILVYA